MANSNAGFTYRTQTQHIGRGRTYTCDTTDTSTLPWTDVRGAAAVTFMIEKQSGTCSIDLQHSRDGTNLQTTIATGITASNLTQTTAPLDYVRPAVTIGGGGTTVVEIRAQ